MNKPKKYRDFIDCMVDVCKNGQGQIGSERALSGLWNQNATEENAKEDIDWNDQYQMNLLLQKLSQAERKVIALMLEQSFRGGVFETLKYLEEFEIEPFIEGYEGSPYNDFIGRVAKEPWDWPEQ